MPAPSTEPYPFENDFLHAATRQFFADPLLFQRVAPFLAPARMGHPSLKLLLESAVSLYKKHHKPPTSVVVLQDIRARVNTGKITHEQLQGAAQALEYAEEIPHADGLFVQEAFLGEARKVAMWEAMNESLAMLPRGDYEAIRTKIDKAATIGLVDISMGLDFTGDLETRTEARRLNKRPPRLGVGIPDLDDMIRGGLAPGELGTILGAPKFGKSQLLGQIARYTMECGGTAVYYSLEMSEGDLIDRLDAAISNVLIDDLVKKADVVNIAVADFMTTTGGCLVIKQFPSYSTTAKDIDEHLQMLRAERGLEPTVVIVDSGDLMQSLGSFDNKYGALGGVYSELRGLAVKYQTRCWTASWAKRDSLSKAVVSMADIADSFMKAAISDVGIAICGTEEERQGGLVRLNVGWCRYAQSGAVVGPYHNGFAYGQFIRGGKVDEDDF